MAFSFRDPEARAEGAEAGGVTEVPAVPGGLATWAEGANLEGADAGGAGTEVTTGAEEGRPKVAISTSLASLRGA